MDDFDTPKIWFVRHAESEANVRRIYANTGCSFPLTVIGLQQAIAVSLQLSCVQIRAIYTSPLLRATQTAEQICKIKKMEMQVAPELSEYSIVLSKFSRAVG
jgi:2,3-bisphosphoglycerate-dependent phosphoglycerate mutase